jgi:hypothetical protein
LDCKKAFFLQILCFSKQQGNLAGGNGKAAGQAIVQPLLTLFIAVP